MAGLTWLASRPGAESWPFCLTFVQGADERAVLAGLGVDPGTAVPPATAQPPATPGISVMRSGDWTVALEFAIPPRGARPDVLRRLSAGAEAVVIRHDIGKLNHELAHAVDGEIITAVITSVPPAWRGTEPDRLRPLAEELGLADDDADLTGIEVLLALADGVFGLSLDEADLQRPLLWAPETAAAGHGAGPGDTRDIASPGMMDPAPVRAHVRDLISAGIAADTIAARAGMTVLGLDHLLGGSMPWIPKHTAQRILAIQVPPQTP